jgi:hypothetical protein
MPLLITRKVREDFKKFPVRVANISAKKGIERFDDAINILFAFCIALIIY